MMKTLKPTRRSKVPSKFDEMISEIKKISFTDRSNVQVVDVAPAIRILEEYKQYFEEGEKKKE